MAQNERAVMQETPISGNDPKLYHDRQHSYINSLGCSVKATADNGLFLLLNTK